MYHLKRPQRSEDHRTGLEIFFGGPELLENAKNPKNRIEQGRQTGRKLARSRRQPAVAESATAHQWRRARRLARSRRRLARTRHPQRVRAGNSVKLPNCHFLTLYIGPRLLFSDTPAIRRTSFPLLVHIRSFRSFLSNRIESFNLELHWLAARLNFQLGLKLNRNNLELRSGQKADKVKFSFPFYTAFTSSLSYERTFFTLIFPSGRLRKH